LGRVELPPYCRLELAQQHRYAFATTLAMTDREVDRDLLRAAAIREKHLNGVADVDAQRRPEPRRASSGPG